MNELTEKVLDLLKNNDVKEDKILETLSLIYKETSVLLWENIEISPMIFYNLKDIVWYNLEHLPNGGEEKGISDLRFLGTKFQNFIYSCNDSQLIKFEDVELLLSEIEEIIKLWNKDWKLVHLYTKSEDGWHGGDVDPSKVIIYDVKTESPTHYGYNSNYKNIYDPNGKIIKKFGEETVLCGLDASIGEYTSSHILYSLLFQLKEVCKKALNNKRSIRIEFPITNLGNSY